MADYRGPSRPDDRKHAHLDFTVPDVGRAVATLLDLCVREPDSRSGEDGWIVLLDPEGHPFCLSGAE